MPRADIQLVAFTQFSEKVNHRNTIMKRLPHIANSLIHTVIAISLLALTACQQNESNEQSNPPEIPPKFSMSINEEFPSESNTVQSAGTITALSTNNFGYAGLNVAVWNTVLAVNLVVPVAAFLESFHHFPSLRSDNTWVWTYAVRIGGTIYTAELHAQVSGDEVYWDMYVTKPGEYLDFNWFSGVSARDGSHGSWTLRKDPADVTEYLEIDWTHNRQSDTGTARYTIVLEGNPENGSYIYYGATTDEPYDAFYDVYSASKDQFLEIEWDRASRAGRARNPDYFPDSDWHYWDENLQDIPAP
jgi:hypothetical protein